MKAQTITSLIIFLLFVSSLILVYGEEDRPTIEIFIQNPSRSYPLKIYVYPQAYEDERSQTVFQCGKTQEILLTLYDVLRELHKVATRFIDEYPEYRRLALIYFENTSNIYEAYVTFKIVGKISANSEFLGYTIYSPGKPVEVDVLCRLGDSGGNIAFNIIFHELLHALGLGHTEQSATDDGSPELMHPKLPYYVKTYPSTLDLHALYVIHFMGVGEKTVRLPKDIEYKMVIPYSYEVQTLKEENKQLKNTLNATSALLKNAQRERNSLLDKLKEANSHIESLQDSLESTRSTLSNYIVSYNILWLENRDLRNNLTRLYRACNQSISLLASKLNQTYNDYVNLMGRYNWLVETYNNLYQDYQTLREESNDLLQRLYLIGIVAYVGMSILGYVAISRGRKYNKLLDEYNKLIEYLGVEEHGREE
jgi:regulator of replication initiation timing